MSPVAGRMNGNVFYWDTCQMQAPPFMRTASIWVCFGFSSSPLTSTAGDWASKQLKNERFCLVSSSPPVERAWHSISERKMLLITLTVEVQDVAAFARLHELRVDGLTREDRIQVRPLYGRPHESIFGEIAGCLLNLLVDNQSVHQPSHHGCGASWRWHGERDHIKLSRYGTKASAWWKLFWFHGPGRRRTSICCKSSESSAFIS